MIYKISKPYEKYCFREMVIDLLAILQKSLDRAIFLYNFIREVRKSGGRVALELRSQLCTFENSTNCNEISFDPHSFSEELKDLLKNFRDYDGKEHGAGKDKVMLLA